MRFLHTSDWHLGRIFYERSLVDDQRHVLQQIIEIAAREKVDAVLIAGDIYDRAIPPPEAVRLLSWVLEELSLRLRVPVMMISGNHDSGPRLSFGATILSRQKLRIIGSLEGMLEPLRIEDEFGIVDLFGIPYSDPAEVRIASKNADLQGHEEALSWCVAQLKPHIKNPSVALAHAYVAGGTDSDSERPLSIGGKAMVAPEIFSPFVYTAMGHLHRQQKVGEGVHYCGSLLSYHFSEKDTPKSVTLVELGKERKPVLSLVPLIPKRRLLVISGSFDEIIAQARLNPNPNDYILIRREYDRPRPDALAQLRQQYENLVGIEVMAKNLKQEAENEELGKSIRKGGNISELFAGFYKRMTEKDLSSVQSECVTRNLKEEENKGVL